MKDIYNYDILRKALKLYVEKYGWGSYTDLSRKTGDPKRVSDASISRIATGEIKKPRTETWLALHNAAPNDIPEPKLLKSGSGHTYETGIKSVMIPVYNAELGQPRDFSDGGSPLDTTPVELFPMALDIVDENSFIIRAYDDSMSPYIEKGDLMLIVPSVPIMSGKTVFAALPDGRRLYRRYRQQGDIILLEADNKEYETLFFKESDNLKLFKITYIVKPVID